MSVIKTPKSELRGKYKKFFEVSLILSLASFIAAFRFFPHIKSEIPNKQPPQVLFKAENIQSTKQETKPPIPPRPLIPIAVPTADVLQNVKFDNTEINENKNEQPPPSDKRPDIEKEVIYHTFAEELPAPIGGLAAIQRNVVYPEIAVRAGIEGKVIVIAYVDENGNVTKAEIEKGINAGCDEAAILAVKETKFYPGKQRGKPVKVKMRIPIVFKLK